MKKLAFFSLSAIAAAATLVACGGGDDGPKTVEIQFAAMAGDTQSTELKPPVCKPVKDGAYVGCCVEAAVVPGHGAPTNAPSSLPNHG